MFYIVDYTLGVLERDLLKSFSRLELDWKRQDMLLTYNSHKQLSSLWLLDSSACDTKKIIDSKYETKNTSFILLETALSHQAWKEKYEFLRKWKTYILRSFFRKNIEYSQWASFRWVFIFMFWNINIFQNIRYISGSFRKGCEDYWHGPDKKNWCDCCDLCAFLTHTDIGVSSKSYNR